ncbi:MAG: hypothetical protein JWQ57_677 [Mucilaginibacter sp.]|nr:hypothetical protein [Mucilaginibacter sp.]
MQIEYQTSKRDYFDFLIIQIKEFFRKSAVFITLGSLYIGIVIAGTPFNWLTFISSSITFLVVIVLTFFFISYLKLWYALNRSTKTPTSYTDNKILETTEEGLTITYNSTNVNISLKWQQIVSVHSTQKLIYLKLSDKTIFFIPKRYFSVETEIQFLEILENRFSKTEFWFKNELLAQKNKPPYWMGFLCIIPIVGAITGVVLIVNGFSKYKNKWLIMMGAGGIAFTFLFYHFMFFTESSRKLWVPNAQMELNSLIKSVEFYKLQHGSYPDSIGQIVKDDKMAFVDDLI